MAAAQIYRCPRRTGDVAARVDDAELQLVDRFRKPDTKQTSWLAETAGVFAEDQCVA